METDKGRLSEAVARIHYEEWDPIGLRRLGVEKNQYRRYAVEIVDRFDART